MYKREGQNGLAFRCEVSHGNCERSASALLSLSRVLRLKQDYELLEGKRYAAAIAANDGTAAAGAPRGAVLLSVVGGKVSRATALPPAAALRGRV